MQSEESDQPGFSATAGDQLRDRARSDLERARLKLRGVLTPSQPVMDPKAFAGRRKLLEKVIGAIEDQRLHVILFGSRGMGKTSLLHILTQRARDARYVVLYGSCGAGTTFNDMFRALCSEIPLRFYGPARTGGSPGDQGATIARLLPEGDLTPRSVTEIFGKITGTRVLVILDEFDRSDSGAFRQSIADLIKTLSDRAVRAQLIIGGVGSNVTELIEHIPSIQRNIVGLQVPPLTDREVRHLLRITDEQVGVTFQPDAADLVVALTEGWPYVASLLSHHAALAAMGRRSMEVDRPDVIEALADAVQEVHGRLAPESRKEVEFTAVGETNALLELAARAHIHFGGEFTPENLVKVASDAELASRCSAKVEELARQDLLFVVREDRFGKTYSFKDSTVPLYIWLSRVKPEVAGSVTREAAS
jgi:Cdc6-like AAA superfamily ATPase